MAKKNVVYLASSQANIVHFKSDQHKIKLKYSA